MDFFSENIQIEDLANAVKLFRESREGFFKLFNNSPVCMSITSTVLGRRTYFKVNKKFIEKFGFTEEEIIGRTSVEIGILDAEESARVGNLIKENGALRNDYVKCIAKSGEIVHTVSSIEFMEINYETYLVSFFVDITKIMDQQTIIEEHARQLEAANKELEAFSYSVSHDLRAPLRAIDWYTKTLEEDFSPQINEEGKKMLAAVKRNARLMGILIDDLLAFARLGKQDVRRASIDMNSLIQEVLQELQKTTAYKAEIKMDTLHHAMGDYALMKQVIINLVSNAIKYSSKKENPVVEITSRKEGNLTMFAIKDNGDGFDMRYAGKLFGVFQRLHTNAEFEGTGIGLAIVQRIIYKHGGTVHAYGEPGKGATFTIALPG